MKVLRAADWLSFAQPRPSWSRWGLTPFLDIASLKVGISPFPTKIVARLSFIRLRPSLHHPRQAQRHGLRN